MSETWASLPIEEIEKKLNTSAASGLSQKAARARFQKNGENNFFLLPHATLQDCVREVITQPSVVLLLAISVLFLLFDSSAQARLLPTITVLYIAAWIGVRLWTGRIYRITARTLRPQVRTIREGQMFLLDSARLVPGDLIELDQGDTAPCDLRLVSDTELRVLTYLGKDNFSRTLKNPRISRMPNNDICTHDTMIYGGSYIEQGSARAIVVETGKHTYIGALEGGVPLKNMQSIPQTTQAIKRIASRLQIILLLAILPLFCLSLLIGKNQNGLPILFATFLCLCLANLAGNMESLLDLGMAIGVHHGLASGESEEIALIKSDKSPDQLESIDLLFLLGPQAFSERDLPKGGEANVLVTPDKNAEDARRRAEMQLALGGTFLATREEQLRVLREVGITPVLFLNDESSRAQTYIMRTGIADHPNEIAYASHFREHGLEITSGWGKYHAYCGFFNEELRELMIRLQKNGKKIAVLANHPREYALLKQADVRMVCVDDMAYYTDSQRSREKKPQTTRGRADVATHRMRRYADILLPCANRRHGGLAAILHALRTIADINRNLSVMAKYLIYAQITRLTVILPTVLFGIHTLQPVQILFDGLLVDLIFACLLLCRIHGRPERREQSDSWGVLTAVEAIASGAMLLTAFLFIYHHDPSSDVASSALFLSVLLIQATAFLLHWNPVQGLRVAQNRRSLLIALSVVFLSLLTAWIFGWNKALGFVWLVGAYWYLLLIAPLSVILAAVVIKIYRAGKNR